MAIKQKRTVMLNRSHVAYDVHRAMVEVLVPAVVAEDEYNVRLTPSTWLSSPESWAEQLLQIHRALRRKYVPLTAVDIRARAVNTYDRPLADTRDRLVDEFLRVGIWFPIG